MTRETLAIDLDDVVVESAPAVIEHFNQQYGTRLTLGDYYSNNPQLFGTETIEEASDRFHDYLRTERYLAIPPIDEAVIAIRALKRYYDLLIITGRPNLIEQGTREWVQKHFPGTFRGVSFSNYYLTNGQARPKGEICRELGVNILVDDHLDHIVSAADYGTRGLLFGDYPWNQIDQLPEGVERVKDWSEVEEVLLPAG